MLAILLFTAVSAKFDGLAEDGYTGVQVENQKAWVTLGSKSDVKIFRAEKSGRLNVVAPSIDFHSENIMFNGISLKKIIQAEIAAAFGTKGPTCNVWTEITTADGWSSGRCKYVNKGGNAFSDTKNVAGVPKCRALCASSSKCKSFTFGKTESNRCILFTDQKTKGSAYKDGNHIYQCFNKPDVFNPKLSTCKPKCTPWPVVKMSDGKTDGRCQGDAMISDKKNVPGLNKCQLSCIITSNCKSFSFSAKESNRCLLFAKAKAPKSSFKDNSWEWVCKNRRDGPLCEDMKPKCNDAAWTEITKSDGKRGRCKSGSVISDTQKVPGPTACRDKCARQSKCKSFSFASSESDRCILYTVTQAKGSSFQDGSNNFRCHNKPAGWYPGLPACGSTCKKWTPVKRSDGKTDGRCQGDGAYSDTSSVPGVPVCQAKCVSDSKCKSFSFSQKEKNRCILFSKAKAPKTSTKDHSWEWVCKNKPDGILCDEPEPICKLSDFEVKKSDGASGRCRGDSTISDKGGFPTLASCQAACMANSRCNSFGWTPSESKGRCMMYENTKPAKTSTKDGSHPWRCFNKPICKPKPKCSEPTEVKKSDGSSGRCRGDSTISDKGGFTLASCQAACVANSKCKSFGFTPSESKGRCMLYSNAKPAKTSTKDGSHPWRCFNKPSGPICKA